MTRTARSTDSPQLARAARWAALLTLVCALLLPVSALSARAQDGGQATILVTSYQDDGATPLPFARFQATDSYGTIYPARESAPPDGVAILTVDVVDDTTTYTVEEETPPACGIAPEPQEVGPLAAGEEVAISFSTGFEEGCDLGSISVYSYTCPEGLDLTITDYAQYRDSCLTTNDDAQFTVADADGNGAESFDITTGEFGIPGRAVVVGLVPDDYLLTERENDSGLASLIFCLTFEGLPSDGFDPTAVEQKLPNADGEVELELDGGRIACDVFRVVGNLPANTGGSSDDGDDTRDPDDEQAASDDQGDDSAEDLDEIFDESDTSEGDVEAQGGEPASIEFHVATCPVGYDGPDYFNTCSEDGAEGISFTVTGEDRGYQVTSAPSTQPVEPGFGITTVDGLPADTYTMVSSVPGHDAEVFVYCADQPGGGPRVQTPSDDGYRFEIELAPGQDVICDWYLLPYDLSGAGGTALLRLTAFACAPGYGGSTFGEVTADCVDPVPDVEFNLASDDAGYDVDETTNGEGKVRFLDIPENDDYVLDEDLPGDALDDRLAYCAVDGGDYVEYDASTGTIQLDPILDGQEVQCLWYIVPTDQTPDPTSTPTPDPEDDLAVVRLTAFTCEPGYGGSTFGELTADCTDPAQGVAFSLTGNVLETGVDIERTTNADGKVRYAGIPAGTYILVEDAQDVPVDSLAYRAAFCAVNGRPYVEYDVAELGVANLDPIAAGDEVQCLWFNVPVDQDPATATPRPTREPTATREPAEPGSLTIHKSECPPGQREDFYDDCYEDVVDGIGFNVQGPDDYDQTGTTSNQGIVTFADMPPGDYVVTELQPADYAVDLYVVVCSRDGQFFETEYDDSTGLRVNIDLPEGADIVCDWYNVPPGPPPTPTPAPNVGTITIIASLCEMEAAEVVSYADDCDPYGDGAEFRLTAASGGAGKTGTTGVDSRLVFSDLRPGAYALEETSLDWCKAQADSVDSDGNVLVTKSRNTNVYIYNCLPDGKPGPGEPGGSKAVTTLPSTGTGGPAAETVSRGLSLTAWGLAAMAAMTVAGSLIASPAVARRRRAQHRDR